MTSGMLGDLGISSRSNPMEALGPRSRSRAGSSSSLASTKRQMRRVRSSFTWVPYALIFPGVFLVLCLFLAVHVHVSVHPNEQLRHRCV